jgi:hypothetical protein
MALIHPSISDPIDHGAGHRAPPRQSERVILIGQWIVVIGLSLLGGERSGEATARADEIKLQYLGEDVPTVLPVEVGAWKKTSWGGRIAVISGNPGKPEPFVIRVKLPPGYALAPGRWRNEENIIVLAGTLEVGTGNTPDAMAMRALPGGSFVSLAANQPHSVRSRAGAVIQIFGMGPFKLDASSVGTRSPVTASLEVKRYRAVSAPGQSIACETQPAGHASSAPGSCAPGTN